MVSGNYLIYVYRWLNTHLLYIFIMYSIIRCVASASSTSRDHHCVWSKSNHESMEEENDWGDLCEDRGTLWAYHHRQRCLLCWPKRGYHHTSSRDELDVNRSNSQRHDACCVLSYEQSRWLGYMAASPLALHRTGTELRLRREEWRFWISNAWHSSAARAGAYGANTGIFYFYD